MAKYSIDRSETNRDETEGTCEMCGEHSESLRQTTVEGATLNVCESCHPEKDETESQSTETSDRQKEVIDRATPSGQQADPDSEWAEQGVGYNADPLPYLVENYGDKVTEAREEKGLSEQELSDEIGIGVNIIRVIEQGQAASNDVGGTVIEDLEDALNLTLIEEDEE